MMSSAPRKASAEARGNPFRVMLVDDSATVRGLMRNWLHADADIQVVAACTNGLQALKSLADVKPEVIVLDIEMPVMDGITALPQLIKAAPGVKVIMASTLTKTNAEISMKALSLGASDYIPKPDSSQGLAGSKDFKRSIVEKIRSLGEAVRQSNGEALPKNIPAGRPTERVVKTGLAKKANTSSAETKITTIPESKIRPSIIAIGSSTGGPQALNVVLNGLVGHDVPPIVVTQHMPKTFTTILGEHLSKSTGLVCQEATDGEALQAGHVYIAPGDYHMEIAGPALKPVIKLNQKPAVNFCRPSVDPMFESVSKLYGSAVLSIMLTGMGRDGLNGTKTITKAGGTMIAQDRDSSVVWGMPGAVSEAGLCAHVLPLEKIPNEILRLVRGR